MIVGLSGSLLSHDALEHLLKRSPGCGVELRRTSQSEKDLRTACSSWRGRLGPSSAARSVFDLVAEPLARALGYRVVPAAGSGATIDAVLHANSTKAAIVVVAGWGQPAAALWRHAVHQALAHEVRWCFCINGPAFRIFDAERAYARRFAEFDLATALEDECATHVIAGILAADAVVAPSGESTLQKVLTACERHRTEVRLSLRDGVCRALVTFITAFKTVASKRHGDAHLLNESLIVIYRILFLLFAEARGLVPRWHPVYAESYTIESVASGDVRDGLWETLQAVARLAHRGCRAGTLRVPPFNGRLFSPADAPLADTLPLDDRVVSDALMALTSTSGKAGRERISYADLGVEQLGGVYEHLLDFDVASAPVRARPVLVATGRRKATGSFYTPRSLTEFLVRRTLAPLVQDQTPEAILTVRVLDPAMGSGAFLVAACRYLADAYEHALIREGSVTAGDLDAQDRAQFRRSIAQRCLFGVDVNPMAVQLGRLSLWLATLASDKPLSFLDHHLRTGNSLVGASMEDVMRHRTPGRSTAARRDLPLFDYDDLQHSLGSAIDARLELSAIADDTVQQVRAKEHTLESLNRSGGPLERWKRAANLWCAAWYSRHGSGPDRATFGELVHRVLRGSGSLPAHVAEALLSQAEAIAGEQRFFHWHLEFPEVFFDTRGNPLPNGGFDAIVGNPPWDMLRHDGAAAGTTELLAFISGSGQFRLQGRGHSNLYQLFAERGLSLLKPGGRAGMILPAGFGTDQAGGLLRQYFFDRTVVDTYTTLENRGGIFPIHRALKFLLITFTNSGRTVALPSRTAVRSADVLDRVPDSGESGHEVRLPIELIARMSGAGLAVPEIRTPLDLEIASSIAFRVPASADPEGWGIHFGRELNATDDRHHFVDGPGLPVIEGKHVRPFAVDTERATSRVPLATAVRLLDGATTFMRRRLAYRDVASASNRMTLIAAIVPAKTITTHTVFCLKESLDEDAQLFLCALFNSFVANYLIRMRVGTHVTAAIVAQLPLPRPPAASRAFRTIVAGARTLAVENDLPTVARLNATVAQLYGLNTRQFGHVLETFPLVEAETREHARRSFAKDNV